MNHISLYLIVLLNEFEYSTNIRFFSNVWLSEEKLPLKNRYNLYEVYNESVLYYLQYFMPYGQIFHFKTNCMNEKTYTAERLWYCKKDVISKIFPVGDKLSGKKTSSLKFDF